MAEGHPGWHSNSCLYGCHNSQSSTYLNRYTSITATFGVANLEQLLCKVWAESLL